jgi:hypothetical protein
VHILELLFQNFCGNSYTFQEALPCKPYIVLWIYAFDFGVLIVVLIGHFVVLIDLDYHT